MYDMCLAQCEIYYNLQERGLKCTYYSPLVEEDGVKILSAHTQMKGVAINRNPRITLWKELDCS